MAAEGDEVIIDYTILFLLNMDIDGIIFVTF